MTYFFNGAQLVSATGGDATFHPSNNKVISIPFDKYEIKIVLNERNEFIGVAEIKINKDFLTLSQRVSGTDYRDASEFYVGK